MDYYGNKTLRNRCQVGFLPERTDGSTCVPTGPFQYEYHCQCHAPFVWETRARFELGRADPSASSANATADVGRWSSSGFSATVLTGTEVQHAEELRTLRIPFCRAPNCFSETNCNPLNTESCQVCVLNMSCWLHMSC